MAFVNIVVTKEMKSNIFLTTPDRLLISTSRMINFGGPPSGNTGNLPSDLLSNRLLFLFVCVIKIVIFKDYYDHGYCNVVNGYVKDIKETEYMTQFSFRTCLAKNCQTGYELPGCIIFALNLLYVLPVN